ncbi:hypothetical protein [Actinacidiphila glaucinigra]|uniref:hypothetical protein n=1 Tax=Actinacidiphila glaucinigra TaxID=235986 RepID=UPI00366CA488
MATNSGDGLERVLRAVVAAGVDRRNVVGVIAVLMVVGTIVIAHDLIHAPADLVRAEAERAAAEADLERARQGLPADDAPRASKRRPR